MHYIWKHAQAKTGNIAVQAKEGIRGRHWFLESDLKGGATLKMDKTGKAILTVLRHLGRLIEVNTIILHSVTISQLIVASLIWQWFDPGVLF